LLNVATVPTGANLVYDIQVPYWTAFLAKSAFPTVQQGDIGNLLDRATEPIDQHSLRIDWQPNPKTLEDLRDQYADFLVAAMGNMIHIQGHPWFAKRLAAGVLWY